MKFTVELLAFGKPDETREVDCPTVHVYPVEAADKVLTTKLIAEKACQEIFIYGQNEMQPQDHPSVSAGDVINIGDGKWLVMATGFHKMTAEDYKTYLSWDQKTRIHATFETSENYRLLGAKPK